MNKKKEAKKPVKREKMIRKAVVDFHINYNTKTETARPVDFSFQFREDTTPASPEQARTTRLGILETGPQKKLLTKGLWLNNNKLTSLEKIYEFANSVLEYPERLELLDISCNELVTLHEDLFRLNNIKILYLHGNHIDDPRELLKLRKLPKLRNLTLYGNSLCERRDLGYIRKLVVDFLPNLVKLDFNNYTLLERSAPIQNSAIKVLREVEELKGRKADWLFSKFPKYPRKSKAVVDAMCEKLQRDLQLSNKRRDDKKAKDEERSPKNTKNVDIKPPENPINGYPIVCQTCVCPNPK